MRMPSKSFLFTLAVTLPAGALANVDFTRDVRPILSETCFQCHGPDKKKRKAKLRLDLPEGATADLGGYQAIVPGKPGESELVARITTEDKDDRMPPHKSGKKLTPEQIEILTQWIAGGGKYEVHWAYRPVEKSEPPKVEKTNFVRNGIDLFVLADAQAAGFKPSPAADPITLVRRLYLDLLGMPPTPEEADAFLKDPSDKAYGKLVGKLLDDQRFGERMAVPWLDLVRFADTVGYHSDNFMEVSAYRDYVIGAFNQNLPFDQFAIDNIAGDLLPEATAMQKVASGYNRLLQTTEEGGAQADEYVTIYQADRVRNFGNVWLAATTGCSQCHDHKYDPYTMKDFYSMAAFFADVKEKVLGRRSPNFKFPSAEVDAWLGSSDKVAESKVEKSRKQRENLEKALLAKAAKEPYEEPKLTGQPEPIEKVWIEDAVPANGRAQGNSPWKFVSKPEPVFSGQKASFREAKGLSQHFFDAANPKLPISKGSKLFAHVYLDTLNPPKQIMLQFNDGNWEHRAYWGESKINWGKDGTVSRRKMGPLPETGKWVKLEVDASHVGLKPGAQLNGWAFSQFDGKVYWDKAGTVTSVDPTKDPAFSLKAWGDKNKNAKDLPAKVQSAIKVPQDKRTDAQRKDLQAHYLAYVHEPSGKKYAKERAKIAELKKQENDATNAKGVRAMLVTEPTKPRMVKILPRGNWLDKSGEEVQPAIPEFLGKLEVGDKRATRMDLAKWVVAKDNPLTSRAFVNRAWKLFFGYGLSRRLDDLGGQGEPPTHPELLDYLAADFRDNGWNVKDLVKKLVTSGTYRQSSLVPDELLAKDTANRLFARQARFRLDAEFVRDTALSVSNLLVPTVGGSSVKPYQPAGYWRHLNFPARKWQASKGNDLYRRGLYTFVCRSFPHPAMVAFDAPSREECVAERPRSNIPQQALVLLNDPVFVEAARALAERLLVETKGDDGARLNHAFRLALTRKPAKNESEILTELLAQQRARYKEDVEAAKKLTSSGAKPVIANLDPSELAAWTSVCRAIMNLYETTARF